MRHACNIYESKMEMIKIEKLMNEGKMQRTNGLKSEIMQNKRIIKKKIKKRECKHLGKCPSEKLGQQEQ